MNTLSLNKDITEPIEPGIVSKLKKRIEDSNKTVKNNTDHYSLDTNFKINANQHLDGFIYEQLGGIEAIYNDKAYVEQNRHDIFIIINIDNIEDNDNIEITIEDKKINIHKIYNTLKLIKEENEALKLGDIYLTAEENRVLRMKKKIRNLTVGRII